MEFEKIKLMVNQIKTKTNNNKRPQGRPKKGFPEPFNMTARQIAEGIMRVKPLDQQKADAKKAL